MNVDQLTPHDLDQLSRLIADALQVVEQDQGPSRDRPRLRQGPRDLGGEMAGGEGEGEGEEVEEGEENTLENSPTVRPRGGAEDTPAELEGSSTAIDVLMFTVGRKRPQRANGKTKWENLSCLLKFFSLSTFVLCKNE